jgi:hypothetical protein
VPRCRLAVHERLGERIFARRPALDEVAGERERRAREADDRRAAVQLAPDQPDRVHDELDALLRFEDAQRLDVGRRTYGVVDDRPDVRLDLEVHAHRLERQHDVREEDRAVHAEGVDRHQRHFRRQLRCLGDREDVVSLTERAVIGQAATRLAHEPDGSCIGRLASRRREKTLGTGHSPSPPSSASISGSGR